MARTTAHLRLPNGSGFFARTDLHGHGNIGEGEEFIASERWGFGNCPVMRGGRRLRVRVSRVERLNGRHHVLHVEVLQDLTPPRVVRGKLFED